MGNTALQATQIPHTTTMPSLQSTMELTEAIFPFYRWENKGSEAKSSSLHTKQADPELRLKSFTSDSSCSFLFQNTTALPTLKPPCEWGPHSSESRTGCAWRPRVRGLRPQ